MLHLRIFSKHCKNWNEGGDWVLFAFILPSIGLVSDIYFHSVKQSMKNNFALY